MLAYSWRCIQEAAVWNDGGLCKYPDKRSRVTAAAAAEMCSDSASVSRTVESALETLRAECAALLMREQGSG